MITEKQNTQDYVISYGELNIEKKIYFGTATEKTLGLYGLK